MLLCVENKIQEQSSGTNIKSNPTRKENRNTRTHIYRDIYNIKKEREKKKPLPVAPAAISFKTLPNLFSDMPPWIQLDGALLERGGVAGLVDGFDNGKAAVVELLLGLVSPFGQTESSSWMEGPDPQPRGFGKATGNWSSAQSVNSSCILLALALKLLPLSLCK